MLKLGNGITALILASAFGVFAVEDAMAQSSKLVWFAPESHYPPAKDSDFLEIFRQPEAWSHAAKHVQVFELSTQTLIAAPDPVVAEMVGFLKDHNMALGLAGEGACGKVPGTPELAKIAVAKLQKSGGDLSYIALDEPLYHIHYSPDASACHLSIAETALRVANVLAIYKAAFPKVIIGDVEPFPALSGQPNWQSDYALWLREFQKAVGRPIGFLHLDFNWREARLTRGNPDVSDPDAIISLARTVAALGRSQGLPVGMIFNGKATAKTDLEWVEQAQKNIEIIAKSGIHPNHFIFQSWHIHPQKALPEMSDASFTNLILKNWNSP